MTDKKHYQDNELTAYLDGELSQAKQADIAQQISEDPVLRARTNQLSVSKAQLEDAFNSLLDQAPKLNLPQQQANSFSQYAIWPALAACLVLTFALGWGSASLQSPEKDWHGYVAAYQALYVNQTLADVNADESQLKTELARGSRLLGKTFRLEDISQLPQLDYKRAQILGFEGKAILQMTFLNGLGDPIALCIMRSDSDMQKTITVQAMENMASAVWSHSGYSYMLIGGNDEQLIRELAETIARTI